MITYPCQITPASPLPPPVITDTCQITRQASTPVITEPCQITRQASTPAITEPCQITRQAQGHWNMPRGWKHFQIKGGLTQHLVFMQH